MVDVAFTVYAMVYGVCQCQTTGKNYYPGTRVVMKKYDRLPGYLKFEYFGHTNCQLSPFPLVFGTKGNTAAQASFSVLAATVTGHN